jgi:predicted porin
MKKSLLVLAVAAAVPMLAQAQTNVTMYGRVDTSVGFEQNKAGANGTSGSAIVLNQGVQSSNRWGVRGSEDLGGGLKAIFNLESGFASDNGTGAIEFRRRSVVGVEGGFGTLVMGRDYDPLFRVLLGSDTLGLGHYNNVHTIFGAAGAPLPTLTAPPTTAQAAAIAAGVGNPYANNGYGVRIDNGLHYVSPSFGGFVLRGAYGFSEKFAAPKGVGRALSVAGEFSTGPLYVGLGYRANTNSTVGADKYTALGARYNFGAFAVNAGAGINNPIGANNDTRSLWVGGDVQAGPGRLHAQFGTAKQNLLGNTDPKMTSIGLTYNYPLSKRTNLYATAGALKNNATGQFALTTSSTSVAPGVVGADPRGISIGVGHNF